MIEFRVLGSLDLRGPEEEETLAVLTQLKRATLLAYLTVARPRGFHTRDKLVGLFWPDLDQERARAALRQSLYVLRQSLGENLIRSRGAEEVSLDWDCLLCDAIAFEEAVAREEVEEALGLYRGEFLEGVFLSECPDLEKWLDQERERLREMAAGAGWTLAHRQIREGVLVEAERTAQQALRLVGSDESAVREFILALATAGDRASAIRFYEKFAEGLRRDLELEPSTQNQELARQIRESAGPSLPARVSFSYLSIKAGTELETPRPRAVAAPRAAATVVPWHGRPRVSWGFAAVFAFLAAVALWALFNPPLWPTTRFQVELTTEEGERVAFWGGFPAPLVLSPDGSLIFAAVNRGFRGWSRASLSPLPAPAGGDPDAGLAFSPDGEFIAYVDRDLGELRTVPVAGGQYRTLTHREAPPVGVEIPFAGPDATPMYPAWGEDGMIYYSQHSIIFSVPEDGGPPLSFTERENAKLLFPDALPEGRGLVLTVRTSTTATDQSNQIAVVGPDGEKLKPLFPGLKAQYAPSGHLLYSTEDRKLKAVRFDLERLEPIGEHLAFADSLWMDNQKGGSFFVSRDGTLVLPGIGGTPLSGERWAFHLVGLDGTNRVDSTRVGNFRQPKYSPDHRWIAVVRHIDGTDQIWKYERNGRWQGQASTGGWNGSPTWTSDGEFLTFISDLNGQKDVWMISSHLNVPPNMVLHRDRGITEAVWSPETDWLIYATDPEEEGQGDILAVAADRDYFIPPSREPTPLSEDPELTESNPALSPDGRWLAYLLSQPGADPGTDEDDVNPELWIAPFPNPDNEKWHVNTAGESPQELAWAPDGQEIFFRVGVNLWTVDVDTTRAPSTWSARSLGLVGSNLGRGWDVGEGDQSFLVLSSVSRRARGRVEVVENFLDELKRKLGG